MFFRNEFVRIKKRLSMPRFNNFHTRCSLEPIKIVHFIDQPPRGYEGSQWF